MPFSMRFYKLGRIFSTMKLITTVWRRNKKCHPELPLSLSAEPHLSLRRDAAVNSVDGRRSDKLTFTMAWLEVVASLRRIRSSVKRTGVSS